MTAEIITIGDEILIGQIVDTNSAYISKELNKIGVSVHQITSIQDEREHILQTLTEASQRADIIIITGGLGPTKDDITKKCLCEFFDDKLVRNDKVLRHIEELFEKYIDTPISDLNRDQALLPSKATALHNEYGTAAGMWFEDQGKVFVSMPGVPYEMRVLMEREVIPGLMRTFSRPVIIHRTVITYGLGESAIAEKIESWEDNLPAEIKLAYLPNLGRVRLRLSARGVDENYLNKLLDTQIDLLHEIIGDIIFGLEDDDSLEVVISKLLVQKEWTLSTAESCTGGRLASNFTREPGSSASFKGSVVCYSTTSKTELLDIPEEIIKKYSVVSAQVAKAMATGARNKFHTDFAISTTGNAGPTKGDSDADLGVVFIGIATPKGVEAYEFNFGNHREKVIGKSVNKAMQLIQESILKIGEEN
ncbi:competence/damage-inducible protein A [Christiangramia sabulilitoris]|uniref:CinA-like protein n=1 Tax=Christiangramia sabulilitoris TaxID=2583991 RepID=A0A550I397_9FLAO|nr:competence/damage-inducible protein A [Christiangramia sabulilitoris]TRO65288.1 competence/damage-inducible protein A [Christiangramia sabulilitoris]